MWFKRRKLILVDGFRFKGCFGQDVKDSSDPDDYLSGDPIRSTTRLGMQMTTSIPFHKNTIILNDPKDLHQI